MDSVIVSLKQVRKSYPLGETTVHALRGVDLELRRGEFTTLVGPSGAGKSTLLHIVGLIDEADSGAVTFDGEDVGALGDNALSRLRNHKIGFIFQSFNLVPVLDVYENVELPLLIHPEFGPEERRERVHEALADVDLRDFARQLPEKLSGGQRQRVAIARALATDPALVLADEPTAHLDSEAAHRIIDLMLELNQRRQVTFLFSTHDEKVMSRVARTLHIQDGKLTE